VEKNSAERIKGLRADYCKIFDTEEGKRVLKDLEAKCMNKTSVFDKDSLVMAYQTGLRDVYLSITNLMSLDIEELERIVAGEEKN
jgi:hypothetical protein